MKKKNIVEQTQNIGFVIVLFFFFFLFISIFGVGSSEFGDFVRTHVWTIGIALIILMIIIIVPTKKEKQKAPPKPS